MFSGKEAFNPAYPTQWALNPSAYQNMDSSQVDWATLAQQWIAMKEAAAIVGSQPPGNKPDTEEGEAPMEVENPDSTNTDSTELPNAEQWNTSPNSWGNNNWSQWDGWGWSGTGSVDPKSVDPSMVMPPMMDGYNVSNDPAAISEYSGNAVAPTFQHGYWTAQQTEQNNSTNSNSHSRSSRRSKSKNRDHKPTRQSRSNRDKPFIPPPVIEPLLPTLTLGAVSALDAAKRRQLPAWIREGLEKMEREKQKAIEREQELKERAELEAEKKRLEEEELARIKAAATGVPMLPAKSKFDSDSEGEQMEPVEDEKLDSRSSSKESDVKKSPSPVKKTKEEIMQEVMLAVRRSLTEILLEVTDNEIQLVSQEELARYNLAQASRVNNMKFSKSKGMESIIGGLGLGAYESSSEESEEEDNNDVSDHQLQDIIKRKRADFERTSREIEAEVRRAEAEGGEGEADKQFTPDRRRSTATPPVESDTPEKVPDKQNSKDKRQKQNNILKPDSTPDEKLKKSRRDGTPDLQTKSEKKKSNSGSSSDSEPDSLDCSSSSNSEKANRRDKKSKKRNRRSSSESKKSKKHKKEKTNDKDSKKRHEDDDKRSKKKEDYDKSSKSRYKDDRSYKERYREDSADSRRRKRSKRSRSTSYESRSGRRSEKRRRDRSYERERSYDKYDRYERSRDDKRRSSRSRSRHRR